MNQVLDSVDAIRDIQRVAISAHIDRPIDRRLLACEKGGGAQALSWLQLPRRLVSRLVRCLIEATAQMDKNLS